MIKKFIQRPVLATVISVLLVILGVLGLTQLPIEQFPNIAPPAIQVTATYPGANSETLLRSVAPSLEESINGVENMMYMNSTASNDGILVITVYFKLGTDADAAAVADILIGTLIYTIEARDAAAAGRVRSVVATIIRGVAA